MTALMRLYPRGLARALRGGVPRHPRGPAAVRPGPAGHRPRGARRSTAPARSPVDPMRPGARCRPPAGWRLRRSRPASCCSRWVGLILRDFRGWGGGEPETAGAMLVLSGIASLLLAATHVLLAHAGQPSMRPFGGVGASVAAVSFLLTAFGGGTTLLFAIAGSVILAVAMAGRTVPVWLSVVLDRCICRARRHDARFHGGAAARPLVSCRSSPRSGWSGSWSG